MVYFKAQFQRFLERTGKNQGHLSQDIWSVGLDLKQSFVLITTVVGGWNTREIAVLDVYLLITSCRRPDATVRIRTTS